MESLSLIKNGLTVSQTITVNNATQGLLINQQGSGSILIGQASGANKLDVDNTGRIRALVYALAATPTDGLWLDNGTAATAGVPAQYSPYLHLGGSAWKTNATAASRAADFYFQVRPITGAAEITAALDLLVSIAGGTKETLLKILYTSTSSQAFLPGADAEMDLGSAGARWYNAYIRDLIVSSTITIEGVNIATDGSTGTKIGTATTQKLGFWNTAPTTQPAHIADPSGGATVDTECRAAVVSILAQLATTGLQAAT